MRTLLALLVLPLALPLSAADPPAPVTLPGEPRADGPRLTVGRPTNYTTTILAFSPDGKTVAATTNTGYTGGISAPVHLWDTETGKHLRTLTWHKVGVMAAAFSPDGSVLATSGIDNQLRFWDAKTGKDITKKDLPLTGHGYALCFSPDGKRLLVGSTKLEMYDVAEQKPLNAKPGYFAETAANQFFHTATWSPKGKYVAAACDGRGVRVWEADTGTLVRTITPNYTVHRTRFAFSTDDKLLLVSTWPKGLMSMFEVDTGKEVKTVPVPNGEVAPEYVQFAREMGRMAWVVQTQQHQTGGRVVVVADATGQELKRFEAPAGTQSHLLSYDGSRVALGGQDGSLRVYEAETGKVAAVMLGGWPPVHATVYADDGKALRVIHTTGMVHDFDAESGKPLRETRLDTKAAPHLLAVSPDGKLLASASEAGECVVWDLAAGKELAKPKGKLFGHRERRFGFDGPFPLPPGPGPLPPGNPPPPPPPPGGPGGVFRPPPPPFEQPGPPQFVAAFSADGKLLAAVTGDDDAVTVWDAATGAEKHALKVPKGTGSVAFSSDGTHLFAGLGRQSFDPAPPGDDPPAAPAVVRRFELKSGKEVQSWKALPAPERANGKYAYSRAGSLHPLPDGATLAVVEVQLYGMWPPPPIPAGAQPPLNQHASVRLIDLAGRAKDRVVEADRLASVGVSPDGKRVWFVGTADARPGTTTVVRVVDVAGGNVAEAELPGAKPHPGRAAVTFRPAGKEFVVTAADGVLSVWEVANLKEKKVEPKPAGK